MKQVKISSRDEKSPYNQPLKLLVSEAKILKWSKSIVQLHCHRWSETDNSFSTSIYPKVTFSGVFTNFESFIPVSYKSSYIFTLLFGAFKLCSNFEFLHQVILNLKGIFKRNGYPCNFIDVCIKRFLNNIFIDKKLYTLAPKKDLVCVLPFIGKNHYN